MEKTVGSTQTSLNQGQQKDFVRNYFIDNQPVRERFYFFKKTVDVFSDFNMLSVPSKLFFGNSEVEVAMRSDETETIT